MKRITKFVLVSALVLCVAFTLLSAQRALALPTYISTPWAVNGLGAEVNLIPNGPGSVSILGSLYGWENLTRVDDAQDSIWFNENGSSEALVRYAGYTQNFGYMRDLDSNGAFKTFISLFNVALCSMLTGGGDATDREAHSESSARLLSPPRHGLAQSPGVLSMQGL